MEIKSASIFHCRYNIVLENNVCSVPAGMSACAKVTQCSACCFEFTIKAK